MKTILSVSTLLLVWMAASAFADQPVKGNARDASGKLLYNTTTRGNQREVRSPTGKLLLKSKTTANGTTEVRSPSGKLLYKSK